MRSIFAFFFIWSISFLTARAQPEKNRWIDSVYNLLNETEKIGQLFMRPVSSHADEGIIRDIARDVESSYLGGILFTTGDPLKQVALTNEFQSSSKTPLLISMDAAYGLGVRLQGTLTFPNALSQGAVNSDSLIHAMAVEIGRQLKLIGVHMNLAPEANLTDAQQPGYLFDRYGEDSFLVTSRLTSYLHGLQSQNILACAKHFPVHGITVTDVIKGVPVTQPFVDSVQVSAFRQLVTHGIPALMPATSEFPVFYLTKKSARQNKFSSALLSTLFAGKWAKDRMGYKGLMVVDMRTVQAASGKIKGADAELLAFQAGNDIIITDNNPVPAIRKIRKVIRNDRNLAAQLEATVRKILAAKYDAGLAFRKSVDTENLSLKLNTPEARLLQQRLFRSSVTIVRNATYTLPVLALENKKFVVIHAGDTAGTGAFLHTVKKYVHAKKSMMTDAIDTAHVNALLRQNDASIVVFTSRTPKVIVDELVTLLLMRENEKEIIITDLGCSFFKPYADNFRAVISAYNDHPETLKAVPQIIFGGIEASGVLPVSTGNHGPGTSIKTKSLDRLSYSIPEDAGMSSKTLVKIKAIADEAISSGATPGCYVLVARNGKVVYEQSFGHLTYENQTHVTDSTIYDLASVTKVSSTLQAIMFLYDRGLIDINKKASVYLPELKNSNKENYTIKDILTHQAGLWPFVPFYAQTMKDNVYLPGYYDSKASVEYPYMVANNLFTFRAMRDSLWSWSIKAKVREKPDRTPYDYRYSDIGFYIMQRLAEKLLNQPLEDFVEQNLYEPLGAHTTGYLPLLRFPVSRIAPTENDKAFRKTLLIGTVHDPGAAMHGGVAGHAGLFSTGNDLAKLGQMLLQNGYYGGYQYYKPETVQLFSRKQYESNHRGLGWAKAVQSDYNTPTSIYASPKTFGHTGYTGTCIWMDPEFDLLYIFLSNRVHPEVRTKLLTLNIRTRIHDMIYQSIFDYCKRESRPFFKETILTGPAE